MLCPMDAKFRWSFSLNKVQTKKLLFSDGAFLFSYVLKTMRQLQYLFLLQVFLLLRQLF